MLAFDMQHFLKNIKIILEIMYVHVLYVSLQSALQKLNKWSCGFGLFRMLQRKKKKEKNQTGSLRAKKCFLFFSINTPLSAAQIEGDGELLCDYNLYYGQSRAAGHKYDNFLSSGSCVLYRARLQNPVYRSDYVTQVYSFMQQPKNNTQQKCPGWLAFFFHYVRRGSGKRNLY